MKKKLLLIALPALMVLSGCSNALVEQPALDNDANIMLEDTLAHEELFGEAKLAPKKLGEPNEDPVGNPGWTKMPKIGVQFKSYQKAETDYYAVRYVAAIDDTAGMTATWTRGVSEKNSNPIKAMSGGHVSSVKYDELNSGSAPVTAASEGFEKYIVYTMYDIPAAQDESYIAAYLTLSDSNPEHADVVSKAVVAQIDGSNCFSIASNTDDYFIQGTIDGVSDIVLLDDPLTDTNHAQYRGSFGADDNFGVFKFSSTDFRFFGNGSKAYEHFYMVGDNSVHDNYTKVRLSGEYTLYVNGEDNFGIEPEEVLLDLYLDTGVWDTGNTERYAIYTVDNDSWIDMVAVTDQKLYKFHDFNVALHPVFILCRMNGDGAHNENNWENRWNQTQDITFEYNNGNPLENKIVIDNFDGDNGKSGYHRAEQSPVQVFDL